MQRFFIPSDWIAGDTVRLCGVPAHQIRVVLRMHAGARVIVLDGSGWEYEIELNEVGAREVRGVVVEKRSATAEPRAQVTVYLSLLKKDRFEWALQKCTEIGAAQFVPIHCTRTVIPLQNVSEKKRARWQRIITEAAEQCGRGRVPSLEAPRPFAEALAELPRYDRALIPWVGERTEALSAALADSARSVALFVGPEGGFTPQEVSAANEAGALGVTLGPRVLRAETAAVVAVTLTLAALGELGAFEEHFPR